MPESYAWRTNRRAWAVAAFVLLACGEAFALYNGAEQLLTARELQARAVAAGNLPFKVAAQRVHDMRNPIVQRTRWRRLKCGGGLRANLQGSAGCGGEGEGRAGGRPCKARAHSSAKIANTIAELTGWPAAWVEIGPALLFTVTQNGLAFVLLAIGHELTSPSTAVRISTPKKSSAKRLRRRRTGAARPRKLPGQGGRAEQVAQFCRAFRDTQGREPTFTEVRDGTKLPNATVSKYRRAALG